MTQTDFYPTDTLARPAEIRRCAQRLEAITGVLLGHGEDVGAVLNRVALSFSQVIAPVVAARIGDHVAALESAVEGTQYGYAVGSAWAEDVESFKSARQALITRWEAAEQDEFGITPPPDLWPYNESETADRLRLEHRVAVEDARRVTLDAFIREGNLLWESFQDKAVETGRMFREGPTAANLALVVSYLGWGAMTLWPELGIPPVSAVDGATAGRTVLAALDGTAGPQAMTDALADVAAITKRAAAGEALTPDEIDFLAAFYATLGQRVTEVPDYLAQTSFTYATSVASSRTDDQGPPVSTSHTMGGLDPAAVTALTAASANGMLVLSRNGPGGGGYTRLPTWVQASLDDDQLLPSGVGRSQTVDGFEALVTFGEFLGYSDVEAGDGLSRELAMATSRMLADLDGLEGQLDPGLPTWIEQVDVTGQSFLDVVARNDSASFDIVTGSNMPEDYDPARFFGDIYTFDWSDDGAAASRLTDFIPVWAVSDDPVEQGQAQAAMFEMVQIVTSDEGFELLMDGAGTSGVAAESALGQVNPAITQGFVVAMAPFMDEFAGEQSSIAEPSGLGDLTFDTRVRFTTLLGTDPDSAAALAGLATAYEQQELYEYAVSGNTELTGGNVGRIRGIVDAGLFNAEIDAGADEAQARAGAEQTRQLGANIAQGVLGAIPVPGVSALVDTVFAVFDVESAENSPAASPLPSPGRNEAERRYDTAAGVMTAMVTTGQLPPSAMPTPFIGPVSAGNRPSTEVLTQALVDAAETAGFDLNLILNRIESAYSDPDLVDERDG